MKRKVAKSVSATLLLCGLVSLLVASVDGASKKKNKSSKKTNGLFNSSSTGRAEYVLTLEEGIWTADHVKRWTLANGARVFELVPEHRVVVMPLPSFGHERALTQLAHCETGWDEIAASEEAYEAGEINAFRCVPTNREAKAGLNEINTEETVVNNIKEVFNVTGPCEHIHSDFFTELWSITSTARMWLTALNPGMPPDRWHADGCLYDPRPSGHDFVTILSYPHSEWQDEWGGQLEFSERLCTDKRISSYKAEVVMRVTPRPDIMIAFSGPVLHRATHPNKKAPKNTGPTELLYHEDNNQPKSGAAWRYSMVLQLTCPNNRYAGPYQRVMFGMIFSFPGVQYFVEGLVGALLLCFVVAMAHHCRQETTVKLSKVN